MSLQGGEAVSLASACEGVARETTADWSSRARAVGPVRKPTARGRSAARQRQKARIQVSVVRLAPLQGGKGEQARGIQIREYGNTGTFARADSEHRIPIEAHENPSRRAGHAPCCPANLS